MKYKFPATSVIAWVRMCRPGSIVGKQQLFLIVIIIKERENALFSFRERAYHYEFDDIDVNFKQEYETENKASHTRNLKNYIQEKIKLYNCIQLKDRMNMNIFKSLKNISKQKGINEK